MSKRRIAFVLPMLVPDGGAERIVLALTRHLDRARFEPSLIVLGEIDERARELVADDVELISLSCARVRNGIRPLIRLVHEQRPDILFGGIGHLNLALASVRRLLPRKLIVMARESNVVSSINADTPMGAMTDLLYRHCYRQLDHVVCQSADMHDDLIVNFRFPPERTSVIHNPVDGPRIRALASAPMPTGVAAWETAPGAPTRPTRRLLAIGRLAPQKGFDLLLRAIAQIPLDSVRLAIIGQGDELGRLMALSEALGIRSRVSFLGYQANPYAFIARADALISSSRYEGLPNVVLEALALNKPVIATPAPGGLREIAQRFGGVRLADAVDAGSLARAIERHCQDPQAGLAAIDVSEIALPAVIARYEALFDRLSATAS
ncbi:MAG: glycosyltransferase [Burkholderiaceae bacterium]